MHEAEKELAMDASNITNAPRFIVFEGIDGSGKTTLAHALERYYTHVTPSPPIYANSFPGSTAGTLGQWVYRYHHNQLADVPPPSTIAPPALQLLHIAAHVDAILRQIVPTLMKNGIVILDRYWWSTYSYSRINLPAELVWPLVDAERAFLKQIPQPTVLYITRIKSLKEEEISPDLHRKLDYYYQEVAVEERKAQVPVYEVSNDDVLEQTWMKVLDILQLPYKPISSI